ncbi:hypothetical protein [Arthrobacter sp. IK3]|uniref:hypothetical protein n=1 Tax=Arthrobacter sp. IK3 TaxID=3448169 RepID=UPI003EE40F3C
MSLKVTEDSTGHAISTSWQPPSGLSVDTAAGLMTPDRVDVSWILGPSGRGPDRGKVMCWGSPKQGPVSHTFWGYGGVMAASPGWAGDLGSAVYSEASGQGAAESDGFVLTASSRSRWLERRFTLADAPATPTYLVPGRTFVPMSGMITCSSGSGEHGTASLWLWGAGHDSAQHGNTDTMPAWIMDEVAAVREALESADLPPGWETHVPLIRPERRRLAG